MDFAVATDSLPALTKAAEELGRTFLEECGQPAVKAAAEFVSPLANTVAPIKKLARFNRSGVVRTADPMRSLIRIPGYGSDPDSAQSMETIIASARDGIKTFRLETGAEVEQFIARHYMRNLYPNQGGLKERVYLDAVQQSKHHAYAGKFDRLFANSSEYTATASIGGRDWDLMTSRKPNSWFLDEYPNKNVLWSFSRSSELKGAVKWRVDQLFDEVKATSSQTHSDQSLNQIVERVAEMEWLNANLWKYHRGSAGISQLEARTWLEAADIDSGSSKLGIDPNLEALIHPLEDFKRAYPGYFENVPSYFKTQARKVGVASVAAHTNAA